MSSESIAYFRKNRGDELRKLAEEHLNHDLQQSDRNVLQAASSRFSTHAAIGSLIGVSLGTLLAFRVRSARMKLFQTFRAAEKPTHVQFADGRTEKLPDVTPLIQPSRLGDVAAYFFFTAGGLFLGGETGLLTGSISAGRLITKDPESRTRIETAFNRYRADVLRKEADSIEKFHGH